MKSYAVKPSDIYTVDNINYFPEGKIEPSDTTAIKKSEYIDENESIFYICYSKQQILNEVKKYGFFSPFFPLFVFKL